MSGKTTLGRLWRPRYWLAQRFMNLGLWFMPDGRYKRDLLDRMYELRWHVEDTVRRDRIINGEFPYV